MKEKRTLGQQLIFILLVVLNSFLILLIFLLSLILDEVYSLDIQKLYLFLQVGL